MVAKGKGKDYYKSTYTHEQLWDMLQVGDDWRVEQAGSIWTTAASGMKAAREEMAVHVTTLRTQWTGAASDEFQGRMSIVEEYSIESENGMKRTGEVTMPDLAGYLRSAQTDAQGADLYPSSTETYDEWLESQDIDKTKPEYETKKVQYQQQYEQYLDQRHETMAQIVADLGDRYARVREEDFAEPPPPPPSDMPGNTTYQAPTGGVFADSGLSNSNDVPDAPGGSDSSVSGDTSGADGIVGTDDDLDPVDSDWTPGSYDDVDNGGLAGGGGVVTGGGGGYVGGMGGGAGTTGIGGASLTGAGAGLFGPARGATPVGGGAGNAPGRGTGGTSPARAGASSGSGRGGSGSGRGGLNNGSGGRGTGSGSRPGSSNSNGRGGTRSGYNDDDDDETYTRETWLREDDVDWGRNRVSDDELDED
ncbi:WXG100 family type VII secretion target [Glycomyces mayteni]|uniref:WXG100 family type VII secretion target n=1 Tax=Glycomyces mayteni TaxID=543887 RepID=A0ABW2D9G7_9ACTN